MEYTIVHPGSNAAIMVKLKRGENFKAEAGAMVAKTTRLVVHGKLWGGWFKAFTRSSLAGETLFFQEIAADDGGGDALIAPAVPGDIKILPLEGGQDYYVQSGCLLAAFGGVEMNTRAQKLTAGLFSGAGFFVLHLTGLGDIAVSAFGGLMEIEIPANEQYVIDNGHVVAWTGDTKYKMVKAGSGWVSSVTSGEGLGCEFTGPGKVWIQTRNPKAFGGWIRRFVPASGSVFSLIG
jgi:uncharacterized protein (TIGR00266 family)